MTSRLSAEPVDASLLPEPIRIVTTSLQRRSRNPLTELRAIGEFYRLFRATGRTSSI